MRINLLEPGNVRILRDALFSTLRQIYTGEGLWLQIDQITIDYGDDPEYNDPYLNISISCGRATENKGLKFDNNFDIYSEVTVDLQFICGQFFQLLNE